MKVVGLTGVGMGKSACAQLLRERNIPVIDTDELARQVVEAGQPAHAAIQAQFGRQIIGEDGRLRRDELARLVFSNPGLREKLERILHPRIRELWRAQVAGWRAQAHSLCGVVIPLLFETGAEKELDTTICVACSEATQHQRLLARGWSGEQILQRIGAQLPIDQKLTRSDYVIWTEGTMEVHAEQLDRILAKIRVTTKNL